MVFLDLRAYLQPKSFDPMDEFFEDFCEIGKQGS